MSKLDVDFDSSGYVNADVEPILDPVALACWIPTASVCSLTITGTKLQTESQERFTSALPMWPWDTGKMRRQPGKPCCLTDG